MQIRELFDRWGLTSLHVKAGILDLNFEPKDPDREAAWELYVELLTRITTQSLAEEDGDEKTALESVYQLFPITREVLKKHYRSDQFAKITIIVLNQIVRPFTAKWHKRSLDGAFKEPISRKEFREELDILQEHLRQYTRMLSEMADVEDLVDL